MIQSKYNMISVDRGDIFSSVASFHWHIFLAMIRCSRTWLILIFQHRRLFQSLAKTTWTYGQQECTSTYYGLFFILSKCFFSVDIYIGTNRSTHLSLHPLISTSPQYTTWTPSRSCCWSKRDIYPNLPSILHNIAVANAQQLEPITSIVDNHTRDTFPTFWQLTPA